MNAKALLFSLLAASSALAQQVPPTAQPTPLPEADPDKKMTTTVNVVTARPPAAPAKAPKIEDIKTADDLLLCLENADVDFRSLQADLQRVRIFSELEGGGQTIYNGKVMFKSEPPVAATAKSPAQKGRRMFQVDFLTTIVDKVKRDDNTTYIFDGEWFVEKKHDIKQIHKRQIVPPGRTVDPLAIGEGPFPIPIGQKRERILDRFSATLLPSSDFPDSAITGGVPDYLKDSFQLKLVPREGTDEAKLYQEVRIWYKRPSLLPQVARTLHRDDSINIYLLTKTKLNETLPDAAFDTKVPDGWDAQIDEFRAAEPAPATPTPAPATTPPAKPTAP